MKSFRSAVYVAVVCMLAAGLWYRPDELKPAHAADPAAAAAPTNSAPAAPKLPLELAKSERVALVGNSTAERMNLFGDFETRLQLRFQTQEIVFRNFGRPADEVSLRQRANDYTKIDDPLAVFAADTFLCIFGYNESFAGPAGVEKFKGDYEKFLDDYAKAYPRRDGTAPRFILVSPIAFEPTGDPLLPEGTVENTNLKLYADAVAAVAAKRGLPFVDVFAGTEKAFTSQPGMQYTINGAHVNAAGDRVLGELLDRGLFGEPESAVSCTSRSSNPSTFVSSATHSLHVFLPLPLPFLPDTSNL